MVVEKHSDKNAVKSTDSRHGSFFESTDSQLESSALNTQESRCNILQVNINILQVNINNSIEYRIKKGDTRKYRPQSFQTPSNYR